MLLARWSDSEAPQSGEPRIILSSPEQGIGSEIILPKAVFQHRLQHEMPLKIAVYFAGRLYYTNKLWWVTVPGDGKRDNH